MHAKLQWFQAKLGKAYIPIISILFSIIILGIGFSSVQPKSYNFVLNQVAELTVRAPKTVEDAERTAELKQRARENVPDAYLFNADIQVQQLDRLEMFFNFMKEIRKKEYTSQNIQELVNEPNMSDVAITVNTKQAFLALPEELQQSVYEAEVASASDVIKGMSSSLAMPAQMLLIRSSEEDFSKVQAYVSQVVSTELLTDIFASGLSTRLIELDKRTSLHMEVPHNQISVATEFIHYFVIPTVVYNEAETLRRQDEAENAIQPSYILQGQVIVQEGHVIDSNIMRQLKLFGYLNAGEQYTSTYAFYAVVALHCIFIMCVFSNWFRYDMQDIVERNVQLTAYGLAFVFGFALLKIFEMAQLSGVDYATLLCPVWIVPVLIVPKSNHRIGIIAIIFFNLLALFLLNDISNMMELVLPALFFVFSSMITVLNLLSCRVEHHIKNILRRSLLWHGFVILPLLLSLNIDLFSTLALRIVSLIVAGQLVSYAVLYFMWPYWEQLLNDRAPLTLNQLANLNHPLLKLLIEKAPGTYHHSILVANLSANAVELIGGDSLLTRVASYYHDVSKTVHPLFFVENMPAGMESPHLMIAPEESARVIIEHVEEGVKLLEEYGLPQSVIDICLQHHGTTLVKYFYHKAKQNGEDVVEADFRYREPVPTTKEAAVIMLADTVEAASRTMKEYSQSNIEELVDRLVEDKIQDNQFSGCELTVHELTLVKRSLVSGVASMYHTRVEYPD